MMSRWVMSARCAAASARATDTPTPTVSGTDSRFGWFGWLLSRIRSTSDPRGKYCIAMNGWSSAVAPASYTVMISGRWDRLPDAWHSRVNRRSAAGSPTSALRTFTATVRAKRSW